MDSRVIGEELQFGIRSTNYFQYLSRLYAGIFFITEVVTIFGLNKKFAEQDQKIHRPVLSAF